MSKENLEKLQYRYPWPVRKPRVRKNLSGWCWEPNQKTLEKYINRFTGVIVELGAWLGLSAKFLLENAPNATVISIDHWYGSKEHLEHDGFSELLPQLYETYLVNLWEFRHRLIPLRSKTIDGLNEIYRLGIMPDIVYIDASHEYEDVFLDIKTTIELFSYSVICGDDWKWDGVRQAVVELSEKYDKKIRLTDEHAWCLIDN